MAYAIKKLLYSDETEMVLVEFDGQHSAFPISLELSEQEHEDENDSVSDDNNNSTAQEDSYLLD